MAQGGKETEAETLLRTVLKRAPQSMPALTGLATLYRLNWRHADERRILTRALASPEQQATDTAAITARLDWLNGLTQRRSSTLQMSGGIDPHWHLAAPFQVSRDLQQDALVVKTYATQRDILTAPFGWDGGHLTLRAKATLRRAEWGGIISIGIRPEREGPDVLLAGIQLSRTGGGAQLQTNANLQVKDKTTIPLWSGASSATTWRPLSTWTCGWSSPRRPVKSTSMSMGITWLRRCWSRHALIRATSSWSSPAIPAASRSGACSSWAFNR